MLELSGRLLGIHSPLNWICLNSWSSENDENNNKITGQIDLQACYSVLCSQWTTWVLDYSPPLFSVSKQQHYQLSRKRRFLFRACWWRHWTSTDSDAFHTVSILSAVWKHIWRLAHYMAKSAGPLAHWSQNTECRRVTLCHCEVVTSEIEDCNEAANRYRYGLWTCVHRCFCGNWTLKSGWPFTANEYIQNACASYLLCCMHLECEIKL